MIFSLRIKMKKTCRGPRTTDTQIRHKSKISEKLGQCGRQNMLRPYLKILEWEWIFGRAVKDISSLGIRSQWLVSFLGCTQLRANPKCFEIHCVLPISLQSINVNDKSQEFSMSRHFSLTSMNALNQYYGNTGCGVFKRGVQN